MAEQPASRIQSFLQRTTDRLPPLSQLPHLARSTAPRLDPRQLPETLPLQLTIKALSGVRNDTQSLARETQAYSKQLYVWTKQEEDERVRVGGDRAAWCVWKAGECEKEFAERIEQARVELKDIRNFENDLVPRRRAHSALTSKLASTSKELSSLSPSSSPSTRQKLSDSASKLESDLATLTAENSEYEQSLALLKRETLSASLGAQFEALRELGEKLAMAGKWGEALAREMGRGEEGGMEEVAVRVKAGLEEELRGWTKGEVPALGAGASTKDDTASLLSRSDTRSFGDSHAAELSSLHTANPFADLPSSSSSRAPALPPRPSSPSSISTSNTAAIAHATLGGSSSPTTLRGGLVHPPPLATLHSQAVLETSPSSVAPPLPARPSSSSSSPPPPPSSALGRLNLSPTPQPAHPSSSPPTLKPQPVPPPTDGPLLAQGLQDPTVAETGEPRIGTGGPSEGVLRPRWSTGGGSMPGAFHDDADLAHWGDAGHAGGGDGERLPGYGEGDDEAETARERAEEILIREREGKRA
ncbi:lipid-binding protein [Rhodotorula toruloides]